MLHLQITLNVSWTRTCTRTEEQQRAHKPLQCFPVQKEITDAVGLLPAPQARSVCICVFSCVQCSTQAHSALRFGRGFWPRPKQKATVVPLQIACSKYRSATEASEEDRDGYARGRAQGKRMAFKRPSAHGSSDVEYRLSVSLTIGQKMEHNPVLRASQRKRVADKEEVLRSWIVRNGDVPLRAFHGFCSPISQLQQLTLASSPPTFPGTFIPRI